MLFRTAFLKVKVGAAALILTTVGFALPVQATLVFDVGPGGDAGACGFCGNTSGSTVGWVFDVSSTIQVGGIGAWDSNIAAFGPDVQAGLWTGTNTLLASTTISAGSQAETSNGNGVWRVESIATLTLTPGRYVVGLTSFDETPLAQFSTVFTTIPEVTYGGARQHSGGENTGFAFPDVPATGLPGGTGIFGPTLVLADPLALPEPGILALFGLGLVGLSLAAHRRRTDWG